MEYLKALPGVSIVFVSGNGSVDFKASPGKIDDTRSYFAVSLKGEWLELHTDIEVKTLSSYLNGGGLGPSGHHEIDIVLVRRGLNGQRPSHEDLILGVECKAQANFEKRIIKQVLSVRRELSMYRRSPLATGLSFHGRPWQVRADPPSEYWLAFADPKGMRYRSGPERFGIEFKYWCPQ